MSSGDCVISAEHVLEMLHPEKGSLAEVCNGCAFARRRFALNLCVHLC